MRIIPAKLYSFRDEFIEDRGAVFCGIHGEDRFLPGNPVRFQFRDATPRKIQPVKRQTLCMEIAYRYPEAAALQKRRIISDMVQTAHILVVKLHSAVQRIGGENQDHASGRPDRIVSVNGDDGQTGVRIQFLNFKIGQFFRTAPEGAYPLKPGSVDSDEFPAAVQQDFPGFTFKEMDSVGPVFLRQESLLLQ